MVLAILVSVSFGFLSTGSRAFDKIALRDEILSALRRAQQTAMARQGVNMTVTVGSQNALLVLKENGSIIENRAISLRNIELSFGTLGAGVSCTSSLTLDLDYSGSGEIELADPDGLQVCIDGAPALCISPTGFAYLDGCAL